MSVGFSGCTVWLGGCDRLDRLDPVLVAPSLNDSL